jgi:hypothetical protein
VPWTGSVDSLNALGWMDGKQPASLWHVRGVESAGISGIVDSAMLLELESADDLPI